MTIRRLLIPFIAIVLLLGSVPVGKAAGWWQTTGKPITTLTNASTGDIKGSSTLGQVSDAFDIPQKELYALLGLPADTSLATKLKDLESIIEVSVIRERVAEYQASRP